MLVLRVDLLDDGRGGPDPVQNLSQRLVQDAKALLERSVGRRPDGTSLDQLYGCAPGLDRAEARADKTGVYAENAQA